MDLQSFGQKIKQMHPEYSDMSDVGVAQKVLAKYPQYNDMVKQGATTAVEKTGLYDIPVLGGLLRSAIEPNTQLIDTVMQKRQQLGQLAKTNPQAASQMAEQVAGTTAGGSVPVNTILNLLTGQGMAREALPAATTDIALADLPGLASGAKQLITKGIPAAAKAVLHPIEPFAQKATAEAAKAGEVPMKLLEEKFGTVSNPNQDLIKGLTTAGGKQDLLKVLKNEIQNQTKNLQVGTQQASQPTYSDILNWKRGSYNQAWDKQAPKALQGIYKNIGKAYKEILHENVPGVKRADDIQTLLHRIETLAPGILKTLGLGAAGIEGLNVAKKITQ